MYKASVVQKALFTSATVSHTQCNCSTHSTQTTTAHNRQCRPFLSWEEGDRLHVFHEATWTCIQYIHQLTDRNLQHTHTCKKLNWSHTRWQHLLYWNSYCSRSVKWRLGIRDVRTRTFRRPCPSASADFASASTGISGQASVLTLLVKWKTNKNSRFRDIMNIKKPRDVSEQIPQT